MGKKSLQKGEDVKYVPPSNDKLYITFTDLFANKQKWLEDQLLQGKEIYLLSRRIPPIKVSLAELS